MSNVDFNGHIKGPDNPLKDVPEGMTVWEWRRLKEKRESDRQNALLDGLTYERDIQS